ncbi:CoA transferase [Streptomyces sp. TP-A0874]|uniref:CoA transferase n=1 Tax=Streptomyces sp. TP-A0874 TaxID=549819 RepID=UPI0008539BCF|nr:CoA transferase [Streptomyces sp. TP-A0874]
MNRRGNATAQAWAALGGDAGLLERVDHVEGGRSLVSRLPVMALARSTVAACSLAAAELAARRTGAPVPRVRVDDAAVATAFLSERLLRVEGRAPMNFARLSRFWETADGWLRTHANYPHHRGRLLSALGVDTSGGDVPAVERLSAVLAERKAEEVEEKVYAAGGLAVALRGPKQWASHPQGAAVAAGPLVALEPATGTSVSPSAGTDRGGADPARPAAGIRVLDLTRVIAGPVATRTLALLGADVLRVDLPGLAESQDLYADTGLGKRSASLDLADSTDGAVFEELLSTADVVVTGYRPGSLDGFGLSPEALLDRRPGLVVAELSAWGPGSARAATAGRAAPWAGRRGFDSLVQVACGIAATEAGPDGRPGALPAQALDHGSGYLLAAAVLRALTERLDDGGGRLVSLSLARTAGWLLELAEDPETRDAEQVSQGGGQGAGDAVAPAEDPVANLIERTGPLGRMRYARSPVRYEGGPADWAGLPGPFGGDRPAWS